MNKTIDTKNIVSATLLSIEEYEKYGEMIPPVEVPPVEEDWFLRSAGIIDNTAAVVCGENGHVEDYGYSVNFEFGVRPVLQISNPESMNLESGDTFPFGKQTFTYLGEGLAICNDCIGKCVFRERRKASNANDYEKSDVKKYVDDWFEKAKEKEMSGLDEPELEEPDR